jgi:hypothetical protein
LKEMLKHMFKVQIWEEVTVYVFIFIIYIIYFPI